MIAAFVIIIIFAGLGHNYVSVNTGFDSSIINDLAEEIKYEGNQLIINKVLNGEQGQINGKLVELRDYYINRHNNVEISLFYNGLRIPNTESMDAQCEDEFCVVVKSERNGEEIKIVK